MFRWLLAGETNGRVNKLCGHWLRLSGSRSRQLLEMIRAYESGRSRRVVGQDRGRPGCSVYGI